MSGDDTPFLVKFTQFFSCLFKLPTGAALVVVDHGLHTYLWRRTSEIRMPTSFCGTWDIISNVNFEGYMIALGEYFVLCKICGDLYIIKTISSFRNYTISFKIDQMFEEYTKGLDERVVKSVVSWQGNKLVCEQIGEKRNRGWAHWMEGDKLHLELYCEGEVCKQVFKRA
uniref:Nicotinamide nucleotide adenylyltransferase 1 n=1 Tax=Nothobranchius furzeri TaxID=105023 RepID=A0A8C6MDN3_NOTFU